jgi:hypothetical protein
MHHGGAAGITNAFLWAAAHVVALSGIGAQPKPAGGSGKTLFGSAFGFQFCHDIDLQKFTVLFDLIAVHPL